MALKDYKKQNIIKNIFVMQLHKIYTVNLTSLKKKDLKTKDYHVQCLKLNHRKMFIICNIIDRTLMDFFEKRSNLKKLFVQHLFKIIDM